MKHMTSSAAIILSLGLLTSCVEEKTSKSMLGKKGVDINSIMESKASASVKAEQLALAAEQLLTPSGFIYADMILDQALTLDPNNKRAGLYKSFLAGSMATKGILARVKPLADKDPESKKKLAEMIEKMQEGSLKKFLLDGKPEIKDEKDVQAFADSVINGLGKFRQFLKSNKNLEIELNVNDYMTSAGRSYSYSSYCNTYPTANGNYETDCYTNEEESVNTTPSKFSLNRADIEGLQHITAGYQIYGSLLNSYSVSGAIGVAKNAANRNKPTSQIWKELSRDADFGKLRNDVFARIPELGTDAIIGVRWALSVQDQLCPSGAEVSNARPGMLFGKGVCFKQPTTDLEKALDFVELALQGQKVPVRLGMIDTEVVPKAILSNPVKDLKALKPVFNDCGKVAAVSDDTLNGLFPHGDLNDALSASANCPDAVEADVELE